MALDTFTKFLSHFDGVNGGKEITDSGATGHIVSLAGTANTSSAQAKIGSCSLYLDGNSDYITVPDHADWDITNNAYTLDFWVRFTTLQQSPFFTQVTNYTPPTYDRYSFYYDTAAGGIFVLDCLGITNVHTLTISAPFPAEVNTWYHIAYVQTGSARYVFINGVSKTLTYGYGDATTALPAINNYLYIGAYGGGVAAWTAGYMDEVRMSKVARWTSNFTPQTTPYTSDSYTKLLLHMESLDVAGNKPTTFVGTAQISTAQGKFSQSLLLDGNSDYITVPDSADWAFGTGNFTIDNWIYFVDITNAQIIAGQYVDANNYWYVTKGTHAGGDKLKLEFKATAVKGSYVMTNAWAGCANSTWYHLAFVRNATTALIFINGVSQALTETTAFSTNDVGDLASLLYIGEQNAGSYVNGYIDELRISQGIARWTADFTPPTTPYNYYPHIPRAILI